MGERERGPDERPTTSTAVETITSETQEEPAQPIAVITLTKPNNANATRAKERKKVIWTEDTVDNEHMNKKKSKCCCIYEKPKKFDESDSESSDDECEHCFGHVERRKQKRQAQAQGGTSTVAATEQEPAEPTVTMPLSPKSAPPDKNDQGQLSV